MVKEWGGEAGGVGVEVEVEVEVEVVIGGGL